MLIKFETVYRVVHWQKVRTGDRTLSRAILNKKNSATVRILSRAAFMLRVPAEKATNAETSMGFIVTENVASSRCSHPGKERGK